MKISRLLTLSLLLLSVLCFFGVPAFADGTQQGAGNMMVTDEDDGNSGPPHNDDGASGNPSHDDDWSRQDKPSNGNWGDGNHPGQGGPITEAALLIWAAITAL